MSPTYRVASHWFEKFRRDEAALIEGRCRVDEHDLARVLTGFRGQPARQIATSRSARSARNGDHSAYIFDEASGMVYILD
jgi:hypothetical protein